MKNTNQKVLVELRDGRKIEINRYEKIELRKGKKLRKTKITKVSPFNKLLQHKFVPKKIYSVPLRILMPELPEDAHSTWPKLLWLWIESLNDGAVSCKFFADWRGRKLLDWPGGKLFCNKYKDDSVDIVDVWKNKAVQVMKYPIDGSYEGCCIKDIKGNKKARHLIKWAFKDLFHSDVFISQNYEDALPITTSYRRCAWCGEPGCITEENVVIPTFFEKKLLKYAWRYSVGYNLCKEYNRAFILVLHNKHKKVGDDKPFCPFCGSPSPDPVEISEERLAAFEMGLHICKTIPMHKVSKRKNKKEKYISWEDFYQCKQCFSVFNREGTILRSYEASEAVRRIEQGLDLR